MKKHLLSLAAALMAALAPLAGATDAPVALDAHGACAPAPAGLADGDQAKKKRMGVSSFYNGTSLRDAEYGDRMADMLISELMQNRNYDLIERTQLGKVMQEQGLGLTGILDQSNVAKVGKVAGLDYIVLGSIIEASAIDKGNATKGIIGMVNSKAAAVVDHMVTVKVSVNIKVVEVETGKIVLSDNASESEVYSMADRLQKVGSDHYFGAARKALAKAAFKIMREIAPMEPAVLMAKRVKDKVQEVVIDMGRRDGIREGQRFAIVREGEPLYDRSGELVGVDVIEVAYITVTRVEATTAYAKVIKINKDPNGKADYEIDRGDLLRPQDRHGKARGWREFLSREGEE